jgi:hypothetical protein
MSVFDDREHLQCYLDSTAMPPSWQDWITERFHVD